MGVANPGFESAGAYPGAAEHWTLTSHTALQGIAGFGTAPPLGWESFERWHELRRRLDEILTVRAFYGVRGFEDFEQAWDNDLLLTELPAGRMAVAEFHGGSVDDLEAGWHNVPFAWAWADVSAAAALTEAFDAHWADNEHYAWTWPAVASEAALFDGSAAAHESFAGSWDPATTI